MKKWTMTEQEFIKEMTRLDEYKDDFSEAGLKALYAIKRVVWVVW
jgi:hypothetical protein